MSNRDIGPGVAVNHYSFGHRGGTYEMVSARWGDREVQITVSPTGRSMHVCVDGTKWGPIDE